MYRPIGKGILTKENTWGGEKGYKLDTWDHFSRFPGYHAHDSPGPTAYSLPSGIGGKALPHKAAARIVAFSKDPDRSGTRHLAVMGRASPGPLYTIRPAIGKQVNSRLKSAAGVHFGTAARFPLTDQEKIERDYARLQQGQLQRPHTAA